MSTPEGKIKAKVTRALVQLRTEGFGVWSFMPVQMGYGAPALDFLLTINGYSFAIETKVKGKYMTPRQEQTALEIHEAGGVVFVVDDDDSLHKAMRAIREQCQSPSANPRSRSSSRRSRR